jgi:hypothetical protein
MIPKRLLAAAGAAMLSASVLVAGTPAGALPPQQPDSAGTEFWVAFPTNFVFDPSISVLISSRTATSGTVEIPGLASTQNFTTTPGTTTTINLPASAQLGSGASGNPEALAVHITADEEVSVQGMSSSGASTDGFTAIPVDALANDYTVLAWPAPGRDPGLRSQFAVVATADGTDVTFVPKANTTSGVTVGSPQTVTLNAGDALPVASDTGDLTGTTITSTKPVAVLSGHRCGNVPNVQTPFCDFLIEQLPGDSAWGTSYLTVPLKTRKNGDTFRVVAKEDDTIVVVNGTEVATLDRGQVHQQIITGQSLVAADKPILVAQYANGYLYDNVTADPFMMLMTPTIQFGNEYTFSSVAGYADYVNVVAPDDAVGDVTLDGNPIPAGQFTPIGSTGFSGAQIDVSASSHTLKAAQPFGAYVYGFAAPADSYGFPAGARYVALREVADVTLTPSTQTAMVNTQVCVTATTTNGNGTGLPDVKLSLSATGVNPLETTLTTDAQGEAKYCYASSQPGTDNLTVSNSKVSVTSDGQNSASVTSDGQNSASATVEWQAAPTPPPTPTPTPTPEPERKVLPIKTKKVATSPVSLGRDDKVVLVKSIGTNQQGEIAVRAFCRPMGTAAAGEVRFCDITVSEKGKVTVRSTGYDTLKVTVRVRATPKPGNSDTWRASSWRNTWKVRA